MVTAAKDERCKALKTPKMTTNYNLQNPKRRAARFGWGYKNKKELKANGYIF